MALHVRADEIPYMHPYPPQPETGGFESTDTVPAEAYLVAMNGLQHAANIAEERPGELVAAGGGHVKIIKFMDGDPQYAAVNRQVIERRRERYRQEGIWAKEAGTQDTVRGENVEIIAALDPGLDETVASLRKWHETGPEGAMRLPSAMKFAESEAFDPEGLRSFMELAKDRPVVEIAALWKGRGIPGDVKLALYRSAYHDAVARNELWFMGVVRSEYESLRRSFGDRVVRTIGEPIAVRDGDATESVRLRPVVIDPATFTGDMVEEIKAAQAEGDNFTALSREMLLWYFLEGMEPELSRTVLRQLEEAR